MDPGLLYQPSDFRVTGQVLFAEVDGEAEEQLTTEHLVAVHVGYVLELGFYLKIDVVERPERFVRKWKVPK